MSHLLLLLLVTQAVISDQPLTPSRVTASTTAEGTALWGPLDGDRFGVCDDTLWRGRSGETSWTWEAHFDRPTHIGAILQVVGDDLEKFQNGPTCLVWQATTDGSTWVDLESTRVVREQRMFRIHRPSESQEVTGMRLSISGCEGNAPAIRAVEFYSEPNARIDFPTWIAAVSTVEERDSLNEAASFVRLAHQCPGFEHLAAQTVWMGDVDLDFAHAEPRPLALFLSGNFNDWCQKDRRHWTGLEAILDDSTTPLWGSCGGAQGLAILAETGTAMTWDCPRCRDPENPRLPIYTHIGHTGTSLCGEYHNNIAERGPTSLRIAQPDPVLAGLPEDFRAMESHVGQIAYPPAGWSLLVTEGPGGRTQHQLIRKDDRPIYAAQFHIEMDGTPQTSRAIMANFLREAERGKARAESQR